MEEHGENFLNGLLRVMEDQNVKDATLSLRAGLGASFVRDLKRSKAQSPRLDTAMRLAAALGMTVEDIIAAADGGAHPRTISIAGTVGAGAQVPVFDAYEKGGGPQVELPSGLPANGIVAVEVVGDSMEPVYFAKDLLFYTRHSDSGVPDDVIGHPCVAEDADGMGWVKQVKRGDAPGLFHLVSLNPGAQTMWNVPLKWAARIRLHWPADLARRR
jgi:transcriptional regulator with XRE-family HTH domain